MPAFTFEKLSGPIRRASGAIASAERRGAFGRLLDRLTVSRLQQAERDINLARRMANARVSKRQH